MSLHRPHSSKIEYDKHGYAIQELDFGSYGGMQRGYFKVWYRPTHRIFGEATVIDRALTKRRAKEIAYVHRCRITGR